MTTVQNAAHEESNNGFGYGQLERDQFEIGKPKTGCKVDWFCLYLSFAKTCKHIWIKIKYA